MNNVDSRSVAEILDLIRHKIVDAWRSDHSPSTVVLDPDAYRAVMECKANEHNKGYPVLIMGLEVVCSDSGLPVHVEVN